MQRPSTIPPGTEFVWELVMVALVVGIATIVDLIAMTKPPHPEPVLSRLPPPPPQREDVVNDLGWFSHGISERFRQEARTALRPLLLGENEPSPLPPDPVEPPPLPPPPSQDPDTEEHGE
jgi:hypothetical protein